MMLYQGHLLATTAACQADTRQQKKTSWMTELLEPPAGDEARVVQSLTSRTHRRRDRGHHVTGGKAVTTLIATATTIEAIVEAHNSGFLASTSQEPNKKIENIVNQTKKKTKATTVLKSLTPTKCSREYGKRDARFT